MSDLALAKSTVSKAIVSCSANSGRNPSFPPVLKAVSRVIGKKAKRNKFSKVWFGKSTAVGRQLKKDMSEGAIF